MLQISALIYVPRREFEFTFTRSSGPGGQNVNKVNSKAVLRWAVTQNTSLPQTVRERFIQCFTTRLTEENILVLTSDRFRDQGRNVEDCLKKVKNMLLEVAHPPKSRKKTKPTRTSKARLKNTKQKHSNKKKQRREKLF